LERFKLDPSLAQLFRQHYKIWIGYHAILQFQQRAAITGLSEEQEGELDRTLERERALVAEMQVKQAIKTAELQKQMMAKNSVD